MNTLYGLWAIAISLGLGYAVHTFLPMLPASLYGMIILATLLHFKIIKASRVMTTIQIILANIGVCFVPAGIGIIEHFELIKQYGLLLVFIVFATTFLLLTLVGLSFQTLENHQHKP